MKVQIVIPEQVNSILESLQKAGYEAYVVGGCVRDALLGREPHDWDITTSALPTEVKNVFPRTVDTGLQHGTVTVLCGGTGYEVTTFRVDGVYEDGRHPKEVTFTPSLKEDLRRRDFTINAMAYNNASGLVDLFGGQQDLENGVVRAVGDPVQRFTEDALRIMRAIRFSAQLGYEIEPGTLKAAEILAPNLQKISSERIREELEKSAASGSGRNWRRHFSPTGRNFSELPGRRALPKNSSPNLTDAWRLIRSIPITAIQWESISSRESASCARTES